VIVLVHGSRAWGAVENYTAAIVEGLRDSGRDAVVLRADVPALAPLAAAAGGSVCDEPFPEWILDASAPRVVVELTRRIRTHRPDVTHVIDAWPGAMLAARLARTPRLLTTHHTPELARADSAVGTLLWELAWRLRPEVVYTSESDRRGDGRTGLRTRVVNYGIDLDRFTSGTPPVGKDGPVVGTVARLVPQKALHLLVEAAPAVLARHPATRFVVVGEGPSRGELERLAEGLPFEFTGAREDVPDLLAAFDVFVLPSDFEGLCYAVIEAQAAGVPVVATPVGGVRENVVPGETGILVPTRDPAALADAVVRLLDDPAEARRLAAEARRRVLARYPVTRMVEQTLALYEQ
jgi:glycosyltransferase involved in cell wall biosynthesis